MNRFPSAVALLAIAVITSGCGLLTGLRAQDESAPTAARNETPGVPATLPDPEDLRPPTPTAPSHTATTTESATDPEVSVDCLDAIDRCAGPHSREAGVRPWLLCARRMGTSLGPGQ